MISIYDFSIVPYALGDVLTWSVKQQIKALSIGDPNIDLCLHDGAVNIHQNKYINESNSRSYLTDLLPAFYTNPMIKTVHIIHNEIQMDKIKSTMLDFKKILFDEVSSHNDINEHFKSNGSVPSLHAPKGFQDNFDSIKGFGVPEAVIALHLRSRSKDSALGEIETHRDSNIKVWDEFLIRMDVNHPEVLFILMGRLEEQSEDLAALPNVRVSRTMGWGLAQELSLITQCSGFMGACSGFSVMASFTKTPYLITKPDERSYLNYGIPKGSSRLPFATEDQMIVEGEETVEMLTTHFERMMKGLNK